MSRSPRKAQDALKTSPAAKPGGQRAPYPLKSNKRPVTEKPVEKPADRRGLE